MTALVLLDRMHRARWRRLRREGVTATDVPALLGCSPWRSQLDVWLDKLGRGVDRPSYEMLRGHALEPVLAAEYARRHPDAVVERPPALLAHPHHPLLRASVDLVAHHPDRTRVVEIKTAHRRDAPQWWDGVLPDHYAVQVLTQLAVTGHDEAHVFADVAGDVVQVTVPRDRDWEADTLPGLLAWWERHVVGGVPPPVLPGDYPSLNRVWQPVPGVEVEADSAVLAHLADYRTHSDAAKASDAAALGHRTAVRTFMREATVLTHPETGDRLATIDRRGALRIPIPREEGDA